MNRHEWERGAPEDEPPAWALAAILICAAFLIGIVLFAVFHARPLPVSPSYYMQGQS